MTNARNYKSGHWTALIAFSGFLCYYPGCGTKIVRVVAEDDEPIVQAEIAHIRAAKANGPRYVATMSDDERRSWKNLVFLCVVHHKLVDRVAPKKYTIEVLEQWKRDREKGALESLQGLDGLTEDRLQSMVSEALAQANERIEEALGRLEAADQEAATLLRQLLDSVHESRYHGVVPDPDAAAMVHRAAPAMASLQDTAPMIRRAARDLANLSDNAAALSRAADDLRNLPDIVAHLDHVVRRMNAAL